MGSVLTGDHSGRRPGASAASVPDWVPEPARQYLAHTARGLSFRAIARRDGQSPSTISRRIRAIESRRDDPLLDEALSHLPDNQREVFVLHHEGELSLQEIADVLGQPRETVKSRYRYALGKIRDALPLDGLALALGRSGGDAPTSRA